MLFTQLKSSIAEPALALSHCKLGEERSLQDRACVCVGVRMCEGSPPGLNKLNIIRTYLCKIYTSMSHDMMQRAAKWQLTPLSQPRTPPYVIVVTKLFKFM